MTTSRPRPAEELSGTGGEKSVRRPPPSTLLIERTVLDEQMARSRETDPEPWGVLPWLGPLLITSAIVVVGQLVGRSVGRHGHLPLGVAIGLNVGAEVLMLAALLPFGRRIAARGGGWRKALGLDRIRAADWAPWGVGLAFVFLGRSAVAIVADALSDGRATAQARNLHLTRPGPVEIVALVLTVAVLAPITEELMFRGLLLRSFMRRLSFWPAALLSTAVFAAVHVYEVHTVLGAVTLAVSVGVLGLGNCYLVRISGRLVPGMMVHAAFNAVALAFAVLLAYR